MLTEDGKHLYVSYDEYHSLIEKLALKCISRDGSSTPSFVLLEVDCVQEIS
jgi:hypothetical protein